MARYTAKDTTELGDSIAVLLNERYGYKEGDVGSYEYSSYNGLCRKSNEYGATSIVLNLYNDTNAIAYEKLQAFRTAIYLDGDERQKMEKRENEEPSNEDIELDR